VLHRETVKFMNEGGNGGEAPTKTICEPVKGSKSGVIVIGNSELGDCKECCHQPTSKYIRNERSKGKVLEFWIEKREEVTQVGSYTSEERRPSQVNPSSETWSEKGNQRSSDKGEDEEDLKTKFQGCEFLDTVRLPFNRLASFLHLFVSFGGRTSKVLSHEKSRERKSNPTPKTDTPLQESATVEASKVIAPTAVVKKEH
jgi:hypothetical protein